MRITVFGTGYVGLVQGSVLAEVGHDVLCVDVDAAKVEGLKAGRIPIYEPGLEEMVKKNHAEGRLSFTTDAAEGVAHGRIQFIAVGTPPDEDGSADLKYVLAVAATIAEHMAEPKVVVTKSTVPVGTADKVRAKLAEVLKGRGSDLRFDVVSNPEFLKEGAAVADCMRPDRIVIGTSDPEAEELLREVYAPFSRNHDKIIVMDVRSAELTKYAANCHAGDEDQLHERDGGPRRTARRRRRDGPPGDRRRPAHRLPLHLPRRRLRRLLLPQGREGAHPHRAHASASSRRCSPRSRTATTPRRPCSSRRSRSISTGSSKGKTFALWGLAFKPNTDDMREAASRVLMEALWDAGARVQAYDPEAMEEAQRLYGDRDDLALTGTKEAALKGADALVILTEWQAFRAPDFELVAERLSAPVIFDGRNLYDPERMKRRRFTYYAIGRGAGIRAA